MELIIKKIALLFCLLVSLNSCEKYADNPVPIDTDFSYKILESYFIKFIAFDTQGNAWIGTFMQGLIKYDGTEFVQYNSANTSIPEDGIYINDLP